MVDLTYKQSQPVTGVLLTLQEVVKEYMSLAKLSAHDVMPG